MAMKIRRSVIAAPVTWWVAHHWASWAENHEATLGPGQAHSAME